MTFITEVIPCLIWRDLKLTFITVGYTLSCLVRHEVDIYNGGYTLSHMARLEVDIYNRDDAVSCMGKLEVDIYN